MPTRDSLERDRSCPIQSMFAFDRDVVDAMITLLQDANTMAELLIKTVERTRCSDWSSPFSQLVNSFTQRRWGKKLLLYDRATQTYFLNTAAVPELRAELEKQQRSLEAKGNIPSGPGWYSSSPVLKDAIYKKYRAKQ